MPTQFLGIAWALTTNRDGTGRPFRYTGVDRARAMLNLGERLATGVRDRGGFDPLTTTRFVVDLDSADFGPVTGDFTLVVASYLLASPTLVPSELVTTVDAALARIGPGPAAVLYTNSAHSLARTQYPSFRLALEGSGFREVVEDTGPFAATRRPREVHYALFFREPRLTLELG